MSETIDHILDECIDRLNTGASVEECLEIYPAQAKELEPLLRAITAVNTESAVMPSASAKISGRQQLLQEKARIDAARNTSQVSFFQNLFSQPKLWAPIAAVLIVVLLGFGLSNVFTTENDDQTSIGNVPTETPQSTLTTIPTDSPTSPVTSPETSPTVSSTSSSDTITVTPPVTPTSTEPVVIASLGILEFRVTDAPADLSAVDLTISNIEVHQAGSEEDAGWKTVVSGTRSFELLALRGIEEFLGNAQIESGHYTQIRMEVENCVVTTTDGQQHNAKVPSGKLKIVGSYAFDVEADQTTIVTLDIDAEKSVVGKAPFVFKPTIKVLVGGLKQNSENKRNEPQQKGNNAQGAEQGVLNSNSSSRKGS